MSEFITHSREETVALGAQVAQHLAPGALIAFTGGLGADWEAELAEKVKIPMGGISDSLNVNVAASIFLYESLRQKNARSAR